MDVQSRPDAGMEINPGRGGNPGGEGGGRELVISKKHQNRVQYACLRSIGVDPERTEYIRRNTFMRPRSDEAPAWPDEAKCHAERLHESPRRVQGKLDLRLAMMVTVLDAQKQDNLGQQLPQMNARISYSKRCDLGRNAQQGFIRAPSRRRIDLFGRPQILGHGFVAVSLPRQLQSQMLPVARSLRRDFGNAGGQNRFTPLQSAAGDGAVAGARGAPRLQSMNVLAVVEAILSVRRKSGGPCRD